MEPRPTRRTELMSIPEAGERLGLSPRASYYAARRGMFPVIQNGSRKYVAVAAFENWLAGAGRFANWPQKGSPGAEGSEAGVTSL